MQPFVATSVRDEGSKTDGLAHGQTNLAAEVVLSTQNDQFQIGRFFY